VHRDRRRTAHPVHIQLRRAEKDTILSRAAREIRLQTRVPVSSAPLAIWTSTESDAVETVLESAFRVHELKNATLTSI